jgi:hypothetical protein
MPNRKFFHRNYDPTAAGPVTGGGGLPSGYQATGFIYDWVPDNGTDKIYFKNVGPGVSGLTFSAEVEGAGHLTFTVIGVDGMTYQGQELL